MKSLINNNMLKIAIYLCLLGLTIGYVVDSKVTINSCFFVGLFCQIINFIKHKNFAIYLKLNKLDLILFFLIFLFNISLFVISFFAYDTNISFRYADHYFKWLVIPMLMIALLSYKVENYEKFISVGLCIGSLIISLGVFWNFYTLGIDRPGSWLGLNHPNNVAGIIIFLLPFVVMQSGIKNIMIKFIVVFICLGALLLSGSRGAILSLMCMLIILIVFKFKTLINLPNLKILKIIVGVVIGLIIVFTALLNVNKNFTDRFTSIFIYKDSLIEHRIGGDRLVLWKSSLKMIEDYPLTGVGLRNFNNIYINGNYIDLQAKEPELTSPHNIFLHFLVETGVLGGIIFILLISYQLYYLWVNRFLSDIVIACFVSIVGMCIHGLFDYLFLIKNYYQLYWFLFFSVWLYITTQERKN